jgi:hypothetical protein
VDTGVAFVAYVQNNMCGSDTAFHNVFVNPLPIAGVITGADSLCIGDSISFVTTATGGNWTISDPAIATVTAAGLVSGVASGTAIITYSVTNSCGTAQANYSVYIKAASDCTLFINGNTIVSGSITLYPNPTTGKILIVSEPKDNIVKTISVTDVTGRAVYKLFNNATSTLELDLSALADGVYFYNILTPTGVQTGKIILAR